jgi:hypothetical protein
MDRLSGGKYQPVRPLVKSRERLTYPVWVKCSLFYKDIRERLVVAVGHGAGDTATQLVWRVADEEAVGSEFGLRQRE